MDLLNRISTPTLLLDEKKCRDNIRRMNRKAKENSVRFKPHFKTHQSHKISEWFREEGVEAITVSSVAMAEYFAEAGWTDITIAFPFNLRMLDHINNLAARVNLNILVSDYSTIKELPTKFTKTVGVYIEIDTGSNRSGFKISQNKQIKRVIEDITESGYLNFNGFYTHPGHSYGCSSVTQVRKIHQSVLKQLQLLRKQMEGLVPHSLSICTGDTPCCSLGKTFEGVDEISPGNFVFYDLMQARIGSCTLQNIAVVMACPVAAKYPDRNELIIHGGAIHFSKDSLDSNGERQFGIPVCWERAGWSNPGEGNYLRALSQEHGIVSCSKELLDSVKCGDLLGILPIHSCLTADCMKEYISLETGKHIDHFSGYDLSGNPGSRRS